jgi:small subunit ribosomal protein S18
MVKNTNNLNYVDYKDTETLKKYMNPNARIMSNRRNNISSKNQRKISVAIKRARFLGLLPFLSR